MIRTIYKQCGHYIKWTKVYCYVQLYEYYNNPMNITITQTEYGILFKNNTRGRTKEQSS